MGGEDGLLTLGCMHPCHSPQSTLSSLAMVVATPGVGWGCASFYACSPPRTPQTSESSYKKNGRAGYGGLSLPGGYVSSLHPEGTGQAGASRSAPAPSRPPCGGGFIFLAVVLLPPPPLPLALETRSLRAVGGIGPTYCPPSRSSRIGSSEKGT